MTTSSKSRMKFLGRHMMLKGAYIEKILSGEKRATIRRGIVRPKYNEMIVHAGGRPLAKIRVVRVYYKKVKELGIYEAELEGYSNPEDLVKELKRVYKDLKDEDYVTIIEFEVVQRFDELETEDPYLGLKIADIARLALRYISRDLSEFEKNILMDLTRTNSIRKTAINVLGSLNKRYIVRRVLRKVLKLLLDKGFVNVKKPAISEGESLGEQKWGTGF